jgi:putative membrane-bound dehydrogenase-like protein
MSRLFLVALLFGSLLSAAHADDASFPEPKNTEPSTQPFTSPQDALAGFTVPDGFRVSLFAAEPEVQQPIGIATDSRGRLWIAENYTYSDSKQNHDLSLRDRVVVLEDSDHDGQHDKRTVFWDKGQKLTSVEVGFGGVWALCPPQLLFIPDANCDDVPDAEPVVVLDGWEAEGSRHNFVNGLRWGPDGWLYGRQGILALSQVGRPGCAPSERVPMTCGIWRYHPTRQIFEPVCSGTTNPWGMDWDANGQMFFSNTVIGHLWHVIPGAHLQRMFGDDLDPHVYALIPQTADHYHWDTREAWSDIRKLGVTPTTDEAGGGHAHCGLLFYQGDNWPAEHRNSLYMVNLHGRRVNRDVVEPFGATYTIHHAPDFLKVKDPWFRGIDLITGNDGAVYIADWTDVGECHENDGVHRTSGRIYKVSFGKPDAPKIADVAKLSNDELVKLLSHPNDWYCRLARRTLQERTPTLSEKESEHLTALLRHDFNQSDDVRTRLRLLWTLASTGLATEAWLVDRLGDTSEHIRAWAVQSLVNRGPISPATGKILAEMSVNEFNGLVQVFLASAMPHLAPEDRWKAAAGLCLAEDFANDRVLPLMIWYGLEEGIAEDPATAVKVAGLSRIPLVRRFIARRLASGIEKNPDPVYRLVRLLALKDDSAFREEILTGMVDGMQGVRKASAPDTWAEVHDLLAKDPSEKVQQLARELSVVFGDGRALDEIRKIAMSGDAPSETRRQALRTLIANGAEGTAGLLQQLLTHRELGIDAVRGLAAIHDAETPKVILANLNKLAAAPRAEAVATLASRPEFAAVLLRGVQEGAIDRSLVSPFLLRQIQTFDKPDLNETIQQLWPELKSLSAEKQKRIEGWKTKLTDEVLLQASASRGRAVFQQSCAKCHRLFGAGETMGPDLTGGQRGNMNYLLENIIDPSAQVSPNFKMAIVVTTDGRVLNGIVAEKSDKLVRLNTPNGPVTLPANEIEEMRESQLSLMPEGQIDVLQGTEAADLIKYLMSPEQVPLAPK